MSEKIFYYRNEIAYNVGMIVIDGAGIRESRPNCQYPTSRERRSNKYCRCGKSGYFSNDCQPVTI